MTSAIITQIKNENNYLDEWISYYQALGVNHIYIIDNNDINGEDPHIIIDKYNDYITYINERGNTLKDFQTSSYKIAYNEFNQLYDWFIFIDIDEFIALNADNSINDYLSRNIFDHVDQIGLNWTVYDDNDLIYADYSIPVQERFTRRMEYDYDKEYPLYNLQKSILRGNLKIDEHRVHNIVNFDIPFRTVNNRGDELNQLYGSSEHNEDLAYIKHYMTKSLEEFIIKKYNQYDTNHDGKYDFERGYFSINKHTEEKDNYIKNYLIAHEDIIGIFCIVTGMYKKYFERFAKSLIYLFPNNKKKLIVISDGLEEYNNKRINNIDVIVEEFINYPYPFINTNKLQIIEHYANKHNISTIIYFDVDTEIIKNEQPNFYENLLDTSKTKFISTIPPYFIKFNIHDFIYTASEYSFFGDRCRFNDFEFLGINHLESVDYKWVQTSFFMASHNVLKTINEKVKKMICYNNRIMGYKFNYSEELYINYLNLYYPELFHIDYYWNDTVDPSTYEKYPDEKYRINRFFNQKFYDHKEKQKGKCVYDSYAVILNNLDINSEQDIHKFFINHTDEFIYISYGNNDMNSNLFLFNLFVDNFWWDNNHNIILCKDIYSNNYLHCYDQKENAYVLFINQINDYTIKFNYKFLYENNYDYIEGKSLDDLKDINFYDIDMCFFSKKYITAYFNNDTEFTPKIYKF